jgi:signal recognition particle subunit SRP19
MLPPRLPFPHELSAIPHYQIPLHAITTQAFHQTQHNTFAMSHARIEEVSDSDPEIDDPDDFDPGDSIIVPANIPPPSSFRAPQPSQQPPAQSQFLQPSPPSAPKPNKETIKTYQTLYPVYFDASRTHSQGRRVSRNLAVANPLARTLVDALQSACGPLHPLPIAFEPDKLHPKDWANPGRVRIQLFSPTTHKPLHPVIKNKRHLYQLVARYLKDHPTTEQSPMELRIQGLPVPEKLEKPAVPRGWKVNEILPLHSPAMSGGGVSENFFKDMMAEMQQQSGAGGVGGQLPAGMAGMLNGMGGGSAGGGSEAGGSGGEAKKKKDKKKAKA